MAITLLAASDFQCAGDSSSEAVQTDIMNLVRATPHDLFVGVGDFCEDWGSSEESAFNAALGTLKSQLYVAFGNHESDGSYGGGTEPYRYFTSSPASHIGASATQPWFSWDLAGWHFICLGVNEILAAGSGSAQYNWAVADLAANRNKPTLVFWHAGRYSCSSGHGDYSGASAIFGALLASRADNGKCQVEAVTSGHNHIYERFARMNNSGGTDATNGVRQFTCPRGATPTEYSEGSETGLEASGNPAAFGVIRFTLYDDHYTWDCVQPSGYSPALTDSGSQTVRVPVSAPSVSITAVPARATATMPVPVVSFPTPPVAIVAPAAQATATMPTPWLGQLRPPYIAVSLTPLGSPPPVGARIQASAASATARMPAPTVSAPSTAPHPAMPTGDYVDSHGHTWRLVGNDDFTINAPVGSFATSNDSAIVYTGDHGMGWCEYPDGWTATYTGGAVGYEPGSVQSVHDHAMDWYLHTSANYGVPVTANPSPLVSGSQYMTYARFEFCAKLVPDAGSDLSDFYWAILFWPSNEAVWESAESDYPEGQLNQDRFDAYAHHGPGQQDNYTTPALDWSQWHTFAQEWGPGFRRYYVDGNMIGESNSNVYSQEERIQLQFEPSGSRNGGHGHAYLGYMAIWAY